MTDPSGRPTALQFTEQMKGYIGRGQTSFERGDDAGRSAGGRFVFELTIRIDDVDRFDAEREHQAAATGYIDSGLFGGRRPVESGTFNLFVVSEGDRNRRKMLYRLFFRDASGTPLTLSGFKDVHDDLPMDVWKDTTTLSTYILRGHVTPAQEASAEVVGAGDLGDRRREVVQGDVVHRVAVAVKVVAEAVAHSVVERPQIRAVLRAEARPRPHGRLLELLLRKVRGADA